MTLTTAEIVGNAAHQNKALSTDGALERLFSRMFHGLVYAQIWEDPVCDMAALDLTERDHVVCIASGGCNVMSYLTASPASISAVDLSPWHVKLLRLKLAAAEHLPDHAAFYSLFGHADRAENPGLIDRYIAPHLPEDERAFWNAGNPIRARKSYFARSFYRFGALGQFIGAVHLVARFAGVDLRRVLEAKSLEDQRRFFETQIAPVFQSRFVRFAARQRASLFGLGIPPAQYDKLAADAGGDVLPVLQERARKLFCDFPIAENYFAWQAVNRGYKADGTGPVPPYLTPANFDAVGRNAHRVTVHNRSVTDLLAETPDATKTVYILLDAQDWMSDAQLTALWEEITRTAAPGARVLFRTGGADDILPGRLPEALLSKWAYDAEASATAFRTDRSAIYGGVHLYRLRG